MATSKKAAKTKAKAKPAKTKTKEAPSAPATGPVSEHERVVLVFESGTSNKVWIAERNGASWKAIYGRRTVPERSEKVAAAASPEKAAQAMEKAVAAKEKEGYQRAPSGAAALQILEKGLGVVVSEEGGKVVVQKVILRSDNSNAWIKKGGAIKKFSYGKHVYVHTLDEAAAVVKSQVGKSVYFDVYLDDGSSTTSAVQVFG